MLLAIGEFHTVILPIHDSFICITEFEDNLRELMMEEYIEMLKSEEPPGVDMKYSDHYQTEEEKLFRSEYGDPYDLDIPLGPKQKERQEMIQKQAYDIQRKSGTRFENAFTQESKTEEYE